MAPQPSVTCPAVPGRSLVESQFELIQATVRAVAWSARLPVQDRGDFESYAWMKLLEADSRKVAAFRGDCTFPIFIRIVIKRILLDYRNSRWGRWRASTDARRAGAEVVEAERRILRDGYPVHAVATRGHAGVAALVARLRAGGHPASGRRVREEPLELVLETASKEPNPEEQALANARKARSATVSRALLDTLRQLSADDRRLLMLRYATGQPVSQIAFTVGQDQKRLYRTYERILSQLRGELERAGVSRGEAREVVADGLDSRLFATTPCATGQDAHRRRAPACPLRPRLGTREYRHDPGNAPAQAAAMA
ncbi:MAG: sigma-70 family RNA polymerase sigma factor [Acidobacteriota bacterium]|nr:sigma-70 family RNA polymerase sigma factor [Acidobacteriota bacterium]